MPPARRRWSTHHLVPAAAPSSARGRDQLLERIRSLGDLRDPLDASPRRSGPAEGLDDRAGPTPDLHLTLDVLTGATAGASLELRPGRYAVGRADDTDVCFVDPSVSRRHATIEVGVDGQVCLRDLSSTNGTTIDGSTITPSGVLHVGHVARCGTVAVTVRTSPDRDTPPEPARRDGSPRPFNRLPRVAGPPEPEPLDVPTAPDATTARPTFSWAMFAAPLVIGLVLALTLAPVMALFSLLSPAMLLANWFEQRVRGRSGRRRAQADYDDAVVQLDRAVRVHHRLRATRLRAAEPSLGVLVDRARSTAPQLWERRPRHDDYLSLTIGLADRTWSPPLRGSAAGPSPELPTATIALLNELGPLADVPFPVQLGSGQIVSVVGRRSPVEAAVRQLVVRSAVLHGPADLRIAVSVGARQGSWTWSTDLPHIHPLDELLRDGEPSPPEAGHVATTRWLVVTDSTELQQRAPLRRLVTGRSDVAALVMCTSVDDAPATSSIVVELRDDGTAHVSCPDTRESVGDVLVAGCSVERGLDVAAALSDVVDLDLDEPQIGALPATSLLDLLAIDRHEGTPAAQLADQVAAIWHTPRPGLAAVVGRTDDGHELVLDLATQGPHALVGGTTGSGKSELLRTLIAAIAVGHAPETCTFLLFDFKGGSAFDACASLPHVVGVVTDLDAGLAERALTSLDAEIRHRERVLRAAGVSDLARLRALHTTDRGDLPTVPSLVIIVDEFATLATEAPDFIDRLIGVAQRGRSLGIHLVLATQRPSGVVNDAIRANTDLRVALRVADPHDSTDIIGQPTAAAIDRGQPGRAYVRFGPHVVTAARFAHLAADDLTTITEGIELAWRRADRPPPRAVWLPPLPSSVPLRAVAVAREASTADPDGRPGAADVELGLLDVPADQAQRPWSWRPTDGTLLAVGMPGSGTTTLLRTAALSFLTANTSAHLYAIDHDGSLADLEQLPACGAVLAPDDLNRHRRLAKHLLATIAARRTTASTSHPILVAIDDLPGLLARHDDIDGLRFCDAIGRIHLDGPTLGVHLAVASPRVGGLPSSIVSTTRQRLVLALPDRYDYATLGLAGIAPPTGGPVSTPSITPGRGWTSDGWSIQVATTEGLGLFEALGASTPPGSPPDPIRGLPEAITTHELGPVDPVDEQGPWLLPIAIDDANLAPCGLALHPGEHALVCGPARSGRTTALDAIAWAASAAGVDVIRSDGRTLAPVDLMAEVMGRADRPVLVVIDDADRVTDTGGVLETLVRTARPGLHLVVTGRPDRFRAHFGDWISAIRESGMGLALRPDPDLDGDLFGARFPRGGQAHGSPGRGYLVIDGVAELVQVATP